MNNMTPAYKATKWITQLAGEPVYLSEKIHGTSASILSVASSPDLALSSGGEPTARFRAIFKNLPVMRQAFHGLHESLGASKIKLFGEAYGGKQQKMGHVYGQELKFIGFEVKIWEDDEKQGRFLDVPDAEAIFELLGLEFVPYVLLPCSPEEINRQAHLPSVQAARNNPNLGPQHREGVVVRPQTERFDPELGKRVIFKHVGCKHQELKVQPPLMARLEKCAAIEQVVAQWVTPKRLEHVLGKWLAPIKAKNQS